MDQKGVQDPFEAIRHADGGRADTGHHVGGGRSDRAITATQINEQTMVFAPGAGGVRGPSDAGRVDADAAGPIRPAALTTCWICCEDAHDACRCFLPYRVVRSPFARIGLRVVSGIRPRRARAGQIVLSVLLAYFVYAVRGEAGGFRMTRGCCGAVLRDGHGIALGFVTTIFFSAFTTAGQIDTGWGWAWAVSTIPRWRAARRLPNLITAAAFLSFLCANGHLTLIHSSTSSSARRERRHVGRPRAAC